MELRNFTPHPLTLLGERGGLVWQGAPAGQAPRLATTREALGTLDGVPVHRATLGAVEGLPPPEAGVIYIVSALVAEAATDRDDLASPGEAVRDDVGRVVGARGLAAGAGLARRLRAVDAAAEARLARDAGIPVSRGGSGMAEPEPRGAASEPAPSWHRHYGSRP